MAVVPDEPVMVDDVVSRPEVVLAGTAVAEVSSVTAPEVIDTGAVPVDGAIPVEAVSISVALVSDPMEDAGVLITESVATAEAALSVVKWLDRPESKEEAALDKMLENPEARDSVTAASVAVAATLDNSEPSEEARLDRAEDAASVIGAVVKAVGLPLASDRTDDSAEETALAKSDAADDTTPEAAAVSEAASEVPVESSVGVGMGMGKMPAEVDDSVPFVASAPSEEAVSVPSNSDATEPIRPGVAVLSGTVVGWAEVLLSVSGAVNDDSGMVALSAPDVASVRAAEDVVVELPSIIVERPTVMAPRDGVSEASVSLALPPDELLPVGDGSAEGSTPIVPMFSADAERVEIIAVELAVGEGCSTGRPPPVWPTKGSRV